VLSYEDWDQTRNFVQTCRAVLGARISSLSVAADDDLLPSWLDLTAAEFVTSRNSNVMSDVTDASRGNH